MRTIHHLFSIAICTYNRAEVLSYSIKAALKQNIPQDQYEIIIIDNNCTDETSKIVRNFMSLHTNIIHVTEKRQGLSFARNKAIEDAKGDFIIYVDDDAEICPDYLFQLDKILMEENEIGAIGGPVEVGWLGKVPSWYEAGLDRAFNHLYYGSFRMKLQYPKMIFGTNMAFPSSLLKKLGGFHTGVGRVGELRLSSKEKKLLQRVDKKERDRFDITGYGESDIEILLRIEKNEGLPVIYDPMLKLKHLISPERLSPEYILSKALWQGRSQYRVESLYNLKGRLRNVFWCLFESHLRFLLRRSSGILTEKLTQSLAKGYIKEWWGSKRKH